MGHATHFLQRLTRLDDNHFELARDFYHDPQWVRALLAPLGLAPEIDRVAVSLDDPTEGPFVVLTRQGDFVTCLGRGMTTGDLPIIERNRLDAGAREAKRVRTQNQLSRRAKEGELEEAFQRLFKQPDNISREDFQCLAMWEPLFGGQFMKMYLELSLDLYKQELRLQRMKRFKRKHEPLMQHYWKSAHLVGHIALLAGLNTDNIRYDSMASSKGLATLSFPLMATGVTRLMLMASWTAGRLGKSVLASYKQTLAEATVLYELVNGMLGLVAIGRAHQKLRSEIKKALLGMYSRGSTPQAQAFREDAGEELLAVLADFAVKVMEAPEEDIDGELLEQWTRGELKLPAHRLLTGDAPPMDELVTATFQSLSDGIDDGRNVILSLHLVGLAARRGPEMFYLPRETLNKVRKPWRPADTIKLLAPAHDAHLSLRKPVRTAEKIGRNDPCACGSGRKFKRCCDSN